MILNSNRVRKLMAGAVLTASLVARAQAPAPAPEPPPAAPEKAPAAAPEATPAAAPAPPAPVWSVGGIDFSGFVDGYYSYNENRPSFAANGQVNDLYNFNDKTDQFSLSAAKLTLNHDPDPVGVRVDLFYGRTNTLVNANSTGGRSETDYVEQAFLSFKPAKAKGLELDFGKFVTSAGAEVIESKDNWNYSRGLLFAYAIPYFHFGLRSSMPLTKTWTGGVQIVNGWNNVTKSNGGVTVGLTSSFVQPKFTWNADYYFGPENTGTQNGYRRLADTTVLTTFPGKLNFLVNYDYGSNRNAFQDPNEGDNRINHWQGVAAGAKVQATAKAAAALRYEYFNDPQGIQTTARQNLQEFTATLEYKWVEGLLARVEFRHDKSSANFFHKGNRTVNNAGGYVDGGVNGQTTLTAGFVAFFGPKR